MITDKQRFNDWVAECMRRYLREPSFEDYQAAVSRNEVEDIFSDMNAILRWYYKSMFPGSERVQ